MSPRLNRQITIEAKTVAIDGDTGVETVTWAPIEYEDSSTPARLWAEVQDIPPSRGEFLAGGLPVGRVLTRIRMRWRSDLSSAMRVVVHGDDDQIFSIVGGPSEVGGRKRFIEITAERYSI
ncbi:MAG TPA: head-tail adaptor protein [Burkholderiaceae bacterium]|nr:head-tail adaptor protein [Burkholderiaceae bacterium]